MKRLIILLLALAMALSMTSPALGAGGDASDPVVTLSYLTDVFTPQLTDEYTPTIHISFGKTYSNGLLLLAEDAAARRLTAQGTGFGRRNIRSELQLKQGDVLSLSPGCRVTLLDGTVETTAAGLVDVTNGAAVARAAALSPRTLYMMGADTGELTVRSATCELTVSGVCALRSGSGVDYGSMARALDAMGLFRGTGKGFALESAASRAQGLVMFLRLLGFEDEALAYTGPSPFTDVPASHWAYRYVAYAYQHGLTAGTSPTTFAPESPITCQHYATFLLRALHYREELDFSYSTAVRDLVRLGLFTQAETQVLSAGTFQRFKMVYLSYYSLFGVDWSDGRLLLDRLTADGPVSRKDLWRGLCMVNGSRIG